MSNGGELDGGRGTEGSRLIQRGKTGPVVLPAGTSIVALKPTCNAGQDQTGCHGLIFTLFSPPIRSVWSEGRARRGGPGSWPRQVG